MNFKNPVSHYLWLRNQQNYSRYAAGMSVFLTYCASIEEAAARMERVKSREVTHEEV